METPNALNSTAPSTGSGRFCSLKWKALLLLSLVLLAINVSFSLLNYVNFKRQFEREREAASKRYAHKINVSLDHTSDHLQQVGGIIPSLTGMEKPLIAGDTEGIINAFKNHWPLLQLNMGIDTIFFFSPSGHLLTSWAMPGTENVKSSLAREWIQQVNTNEQPITSLECGQDCIQYTVVPMLAGSRTIGIVVLGSSMADVILDFKKVTETDIGMIIFPKNERIADNADRPPSIWKGRIVALTDADKNLPLLKKVSEETPSFSAAMNGITTDFEDRYYEVRLVPFQGVTSAGTGYWVLIEDTTHVFARIQMATKQSLFAGIAGLLLSEAVLLIVLQAPMSRLRRTAQTLPLLAQSAFQTVRSTIGEKTKPRWINDEVDLLNDTAIDLSYQLEKLETQVEERTKVLAARMDELAYERDFVKSLLHTAQVIILTQDTHGKIMMISQHGEILTGYRETELLGRSFNNILFNDTLPSDIRNSLKELAVGYREYLSHECDMVCKDGKKRSIAWFHSRLSRGSDTEPAIMSVGLDITQRLEAEARISWLADHDSLTGLFNRRRFQNELERVLAEVRRYNRSGALLFFDLDHFKYVNDTSGHHAGDALLRIIADKLSHLVRTTDVIGRMGGDEFAMIISQAEPDDAVKMARKLCRHLNDIELPVRGGAYKVTASIGIVIFPLHGVRVYDLLANADLAMYQAKESGPGRWHLFSSSDDARERMEANVYWKKRIEQALEKDGFMLYYQPIMDIMKGTISHYEVLLRMLNEDGTIVAPGAFIDVAEHTGLIHSIDHLVLNKAAAHQITLSRQNHDITFTINLSARAFENPELLPFLKQVLGRTGIEPAKLILEITETAAVADISATNKLMREIKKLGCSFALDDFGVGFSSFNYLKQLPVDYVKIAGSFIQELSNNPDNQVFVKALGEVARGFGKKTIAEYVEDAETLDLLAKYNIDFAQGNHIGKPSQSISLRARKDN